jgi:hypothetical protein
VGARLARKKGRTKVRRHTLLGVDVCEQEDTIEARHPDEDWVTPNNVAQDIAQVLTTTHRGSDGE